MSASFYIRIAISLAALCIAIIGVYVAYSIQITIAKINKENRERDEFEHKMHIFTDDVDKMIIVYKELLNDTGKRTTSDVILSASANVLANQAVLTYYAFQDLLNCSFYDKEFSSSKEVQSYEDEIKKHLTNVSDLALIVASERSRSTMIIADIIEFNNKYAKWRREISKTK